MLRKAHTKRDPSWQRFILRRLVSDLFVLWEFCMARNLYRERSTLREVNMTSRRLWWRSILRKLWKERNPHWERCKLKEVLT